MQTTALTYDAALELVAREWTGQDVDVSVWRGDEFESGFSGRLAGVTVHDPAGNKQVETDAGSVVIYRELFEGAAWAEIATGLRPVTRELTIRVGGRCVEIHDP